MIKEIRSSVYPEDISLRVKGVALMLVPAITSVLKGFDIVVQDEALTSVLEALFLVVGFAMFIVGQVRGKKR